MQLDDRRYCMEGGEDCGFGVKPDPRFPRLDIGNDVLCELCFSSAIEELREVLERVEDND